MAVKRDLAICCCRTAAEAFLDTPCRSQGCLEGGCELCAQNPSRRCSDNFSAKYLSGDSLLARCGASIRVEVIDRVTGDAVQDDSLASVQLEVGSGMTQGLGCGAVACTVVEAPCRPNMLLRQSPLAACSGAAGGAISVAAACLMLHSQHDTAPQTLGDGCDQLATHYERV